MAAHKATFLITECSVLIDVCGQIPFLVSPTNFTPFFVQNRSSIYFGGLSTFMIRVLSSINCEIKRTRQVYIILTVEKGNRVMSNYGYFDGPGSNPETADTKPVDLFTNNMNIREAINMLCPICDETHVPQRI